MTKYTYIKGCCDSGCVWPEEIEIEVSDGLQNTIDELHQLQLGNPIITKIEIKAPDEFISDETQDKISEECRIDPIVLGVIEGVLYFSLYSKYNNSYTTEYHPKE